MILHVLAHALIATTLLQLMPVDARDFEVLAQQNTQQVSISTYDARTLSLNRLPVSGDRSLAPRKRREQSLGVVTSAVSALVLDRKSGEVLFAKNVSEPRSIGSITKLMTAHVFLQTQPDLSARVALEKDDLRSGGVQHLSLFDTYTVNDLLFASLVASDNTATAALMRLSGFSSGDFVAKMNEEAASMGMKQTRFVDATGLSSKNQSVVGDIASLLDQVARNDTIQRATQTNALTITGGSGATYTFFSTDELLETFINRDPYKIKTAKTGFLPEAGYCLGTVFQYENDHDIIVVVLGAHSKDGRFKDVKALAAWAYDTYAWDI